MPPAQSCCHSPLNCGNDVASHIAYKSSNSTALLSFSRQAERRGWESSLDAVPVESVLLQEINPHKEDHGSLLLTMEFPVFWKQLAGTRPLQLHKIMQSLLEPCTGQLSLCGQVSLQM